MQRTVPAGEPDTSRRAKRSATISLVLIAGAGATAFLLAQRDPSQREEDTLVYDNDGACIAGGLRPADECIAEYRSALESDAASAPRYPTQTACESHHGAGGCVSRSASTPGDAPSVVPLMVGYMIGRTAAQGLPAQPLYRHAPDDERQGTGGSGWSAGNYCTAAGGRVVTTSGGSVARVSSEVARTRTSAPRTVARGGFGGTGRALSASGGHAGGFGGS